MTSIEETLGDSILLGLSALNLNGHLDMHMCFC